MSAVFRIKADNILDTSALNNLGYNSHFTPKMIIIIQTKIIICVKKMKTIAFSILFSILYDYQVYDLSFCISSLFRFLYQKYKLNAV